MWPSQIALRWPYYLVMWYWLMDQYGNNTVDNIPPLWNVAVGYFKLGWEHWKGLVLHFIWKVTAWIVQYLFEWNVSLEFCAQLVMVEHDPQNLITQIQEGFQVSQKGKSSIMQISCSAFEWFFIITNTRTVTFFLHTIQ